MNQNYILIPILIIQILTLIYALRFFLMIFPLPDIFGVRRRRSARRRKKRRRLKIEARERKNFFKHQKIMSKRFPISSSNLSS